MSDNTLVLTLPAEVFPEGKYYPVSVAAFNVADDDSSFKASFIQSISGDTVILEVKTESETHRHKISLRDILASYVDHVSPEHSSSMPRSGGEEGE